MKQPAHDSFLILSHLSGIKAMPSQGVLQGRGELPFTIMHTAAPKLSRTEDGVLPPPAS